MLHCYLITHAAFQRGKYWMFFLLSIFFYAFAQATTSERHFDRAASLVDEGNIPPITAGTSLAACGGAMPFQVLHFTKTNGFDHQTREQSAQLFTEIGETENFTVVDSESPTVFDDLDELLTYEVIIFSNTSGSGLLNADQQANVEAYIAAGGSFLGIHAATDTYRNQSWPFYNELVGGIVQKSPNHTSPNYEGTMDVIGSHPSTVNLPNPWNKVEEYYYWELNGGQLSPNINETLRVQSTGDESYDAARPISWYQEFDSGARSYYTALGHGKSNYTDPDNDFRQLLRDALCWCVLAEGQNGGGDGEVTITGELRTWHRIALNFTGPNTSETATPNPFSDYNLTVTFTHAEDSTSYTVPGFYAADGDAAETSADIGDQWRVYFAPDRPGDWNYSVSFTTGPDVAIEGGGTSAGFMDGISGSFSIAPTDKTDRDHRGKGRLEYVGEHYLRYAATGEWFVKAGADAPENTLAYEDFDDTPNKDNRRKSWEPHAQDYDSAEAEPYTWQNGKGSELLGVVHYLADKGVNAMSFLTFSLEGDDENVFPHRLTGSVADFEATNNNWDESVYRDRFDVSRLDQWERIFAYADQKGIYLHFKLQEQENDQLMDGGDVERERKLYYRELIARFAHHLALNWNMGEENTQTEAQRKAMAEYFAQTDPYDHHRVLHTYPGQQEMVYTPLLAEGSDYTGVSIQTGGTGFDEVYSKSLQWVQESAAAGQKWVVAVDEPNNFGTGIPNDPNDRKRVRHEVVWAAFMAGGAGTEFYYGNPCGDTRCEDHRTRDDKYTDAGYALHFFQTHFQPYLPVVENADELTPDEADYVLANPGLAYAIYRPDGGTTTIDLPAGNWQVQWYNPRDGSLGEVTVLEADALQAPDGENDWTALILPANCTAGTACNDGDPCTENDVLDEDCNCSGTFVDSDGDGICDAEESTVEISGELRTWHRVALDFTGPNTSETATPNPFSDYRLEVTFTHAAGGISYTVPGFYAADGAAAETSADAGDRWRVYFAPDRSGDWDYSVSFTTGPDAAIAGGGTSAGFMDGATGSFSVAPTDKTGRDHRGKGRLEYVGEHYLRYAGTGEWFVKAGADAPENTLAYEDFDDVPDRGNRRKSWQPHAQDYDAAEAESYTWQNGKGSELLGVVRYLSEKGVNAMSFLTFSLEGDDKNVFPHRLIGTIDEFESTNNPWDESVYRDRFDVSRLDQWERIFAYADRQGIYLHFKLQEQENDQLMDGGDVGRERKLYYRELIARYGHHLALNWNMGEENTQTTAQRRAMADYFAGQDPYNHPRVIHTYAGEKDAVYGPLLGDESAYTGASLQTSNASFSELFDDVADWVGNSAQAGKKWVVAVDEPGNAIIGIDADPDDRKLVRHRVVWATFMAGGAGTEFYYGYDSGCSDLNCQDHRTRDQKYTDAAYALHFFQTHFQAYLPNVANDDDRTVDTGDYVLAAPGQAYAVYRPNGGTTNIDLPTGAWQVRWYNPRDGSLGDPIVLGTDVLEAPDSENDWTALILPTNCAAGTACNDGDPCTEDDVLDEDCNCSGTTTDSDNDGVCDALDQCPGQDDTQDADGDGIPDGCDDCDGTLEGTSCDDGDPETSNDRYNAACECIGQPPAGANEYWLEAECAEYGDQWGLSDDPEASRQQYLRSLETETSLGDPSTDPAYRIRFTVDIATAATYRIFARATGTEDGDDSFWVRVNDGNWVEWNKINYPYDLSGWVWEQVAEWTGGNDVTPLTFDLPTGVTTVDFVHREPGTRLDKLLITSAGEAPTGIGAEAENCDDCDGQPGDSCDDGDACTTNDVLDADCNCAGEVADSDNDGVCDADDQCPGADDTLDADGDGIPDGCDDCDGQPGDSCDDGDACTINDVLDADCNCAGEVVDSDEDGVCDAEDQCPGEDDTLDADGDGIPDGCDDCDGQPGDSCDDGDACTINDVLDADCNCAGEVADSDNDGVCDADDQCPGADDTLDADGDGTPDACDNCDNALVGSPCDDGDDTTVADVIRPNCNCVGQPPAAAGQYWLEAECADLGAQWLPTPDVLASLNTMVRSAEDTAVFADAAPAAPEYAVRFSVPVASAGSYEIFARVAVAGAAGDSFWVRVNGGTWVKWEQINFPYTATGFTWQPVGESTDENPPIPVTYFFNEGVNTVEFVYREPGVQLDKILVAQSTPLPAGLGAAAINCGTSSVSDRPEEQLGRLFPNPALNEVTLTGLPVPASGLRLLDVQGRIQRRFVDGEQLTRTLDMSDLPKGVYFLHGQVGTRAAVWRIVLQ